MLTGKVISWKGTDERVAVCTPQIGARLVGSITLPEGKVELEPPQPAFIALRQFVSAIKAGTFTERNIEWHETEEDFLARVISRVVPFGATDVKIHLASELPRDRRFRNSWRHDLSKRIDVQMPLARQEHMDRIRQVRDKELEKLDVEMLKAIEADDRPKQNELAVKRQRLRDIPQDFDLDGAHDSDALDALWPSDLPART